MRRRADAISASAMCDGSRPWRFRFELFLVRMCRKCDWPRLNLPLPVLRKRLAAPRLVFNFGIRCSICSLIRTGTPAAAGGLWDLCEACLTRSTTHFLYSLPRPVPRQLNSFDQVFFGAKTMISCRPSIFGNCSTILNSSRSLRTLSSSCIPNS